MEAVDGGLKNEMDPDNYLRTKETLLAFILTLEVQLPRRLARMC